MNAMKTTTDKAGRVVIPKKIRDEAGLAPGTELEVRVENGTIELEPVAIPMDLVQRGPLWVLVPRVPGPPLTNEIVERVKEEIWRERFGMFFPE
jgi:AbrB family looped-hinge helix DNA binding protein